MLQIGTPVLCNFYFPVQGCSERVFGSNLHDQNMEKSCPNQSGSSSDSILKTFSPAEPSVDLDLEYIENVFTYLER